MKAHNLPEVLEKACNECLFTKNRVVSERRAQGIIETCKKNGTHFICHKGSLADRPVMCRNWFDQIEVPRFVAELDPDIARLPLQSQVQIIERLAKMADITFIPEEELRREYHGRANQTERTDQESAAEEI